MKLILPELMKEAERPGDLRNAVNRYGYMDLFRLSEKFIFDTGMDRDEDTTSAIRETGIAMVEQGRLHLPAPITWIEDPFPDDPTRGHRRCYMCVERDGVITIWVFEAFGKLLGGQTTYSYFDVPIRIDTSRDKSVGGFTYAEYPMELIESGVPPMFRELVGEVLYAMVKFIVVLGAKGTERERCQREVRGNSKKDNPKDYPYTIVRVPLDYAAPATTGGGTHAPPRKHFVRGYQWGKNTRPEDEQKWIDPYWRGHEDRGVIKHQFYDVR